LNNGLAVFQTTHAGETNFVAYLVNQQGESVQTLFNAVGNYKAKQGFEIKKPGEYLLNVQGDGAWTFAISQPRPTSGDGTSASFTGEGTDITPFLSLKKGLTVFKTVYQGEGRFTVSLIDQNGRPVEHLFNALDAFEGSIPVQIPQDGIYFLNIGASGDWQIDVE
jgi:hypothetical protein